ncbi:MAG TPA: hypothetical protein VGF60_15135 [Xanthobacteraceae bacterium]|jgi:TPR repeat protein
MRRIAYVLLAATTLLGIDAAQRAAASPVLSSIGELASSCNAEACYVAAVGGDPKAQAELASRYTKGDGVARSDDYAFQWSWRAAQQGNADAQMMLSDFFANGKAVPRDNVMALKWASLARANARTAETAESARKMIVSLKRQMSAREINDALARVDRWRPEREPRYPLAEDAQTTGHSEGMALASAVSTPAGGRPAAAKPEPSPAVAAGAGAERRGRRHFHEPAAEADEQAMDRTRPWRSFGQLLRLARRLGF